MQYKPFANTGLKVSSVGMGTYYDPLWILTARLGWFRNRELKLEALKTGLDGGINLIDTAEIYGSEPLVAKSIKGFERESLFIATKVWSNHLRHDSLIRALNASLRRLELSYVDLYQIHFPNNSVPVKETMGAMEELVEQGKVRFIGVSNFSLKKTIEATEALKKHELAALQVNYSLANRSIERDLLPYCEKENIAVLAYYPLAHGKLASSKRLLSVSERLNRTPAQLALNWLASKRTVFPIPRASNPAHVKENLRAVDFTLGDSDLKELESAV